MTGSLTVYAINANHLWNRQLGLMSDTWLLSAYDFDMHIPSSVRSFPLNFMNRFC